MRDRFELSNAFRNFLALAIEVETIDAAEVFVLGSKMGRDAGFETEAMVASDIIETAHINRHWDGKQHRMLCEAAEKANWFRVAAAGE